MRVTGKLANNPSNTFEILQGEKIPDIGDKTPYNGKFAVEIPSFINLDMDDSSPCADYILPVDAGSLHTKIFQGMLAAYPMYDWILFNPLLEDTDMDDLAFDDTLPDGSIVRAQVGRGTNSFQSTPPTPSTPYHASNQVGISPCSVALLPANTKVSPQRDGLLVTAKIQGSNGVDISAETGGAGAKDFMVYWKIYQFETTEDYRSEYGKYAGENSPAIRKIIEIDQEPSDLEVFLSVDDGINYFPITRLTPTAFCVPGTEIRLLFRNTGSAKYYIASYAIIF